MEIKRGVKNDSKISGKMAQWSHHQLREGRLGKAVWRGRQTSGVQFSTCLDFEISFRHPSLKKKKKCRQLEVYSDKMGIVNLTILNKQS